MSSDKANLPEVGEQIVFERGDCQQILERMTFRVREAHAHGFGMIELTGWKLDQLGWPDDSRELRVCVPVATVEARRKHR